MVDAMLDQLRYWPRIFFLYVIFSLISEFQRNLLIARHVEFDKRKNEAALLNFLHIFSFDYLRIDENVKFFGLTKRRVGIGLQLELWMNLLIQEKQTMQILNLIGCEIRKVIVGCCWFHFRYLLMKLVILKNSGGWDFE